MGCCCNVCTRGLPVSKGDIGPKCLAMGLASMGCNVSSKVIAQAYRERLKNVKSPKDVVKEFNSPDMGETDPQRFHENVIQFQTSQGVGTRKNLTPEEDTELRKKFKDDTEKYVDSVVSKEEDPNGIGAFDTQAFYKTQLKEIDETLVAQKKDMDLLKGLGLNVKNLSEEDLKKFWANLPSDAYFMSHMGEFGITHKGGIHKRLDEMLANSIAYHTNLANKKIYAAEYALLTETDPAKIEKLNRIIHGKAQETLDALLEAGATEEEIVSQKIPMEKVVKANNYIRSKPRSQRKKDLGNNPSKMALMEKINRLTTTKSLARLSYRLPIAFISGIAIALSTMTLGKRHFLRKASDKKTNKIFKDVINNTLRDYQKDQSAPKVLNPQGTGDFLKAKKSAESAEVKNQKRSQVEEKLGRKINPFKGDSAVKIAKGQVGKWSQSKYNKSDYQNKKFGGAIKDDAQLIKDKYSQTQKQTFDKMPEKAKAEAKDAYVKLMKLGVSSKDLINDRNPVEIRNSLNKEKLGRMLNLKQDAAIDKNFNDAYEKAYIGQYLFATEEKKKSKNDKQVPLGAKAA